MMAKLSEAELNELRRLEKVTNVGRMQFEDYSIGRTEQPTPAQKAHMKEVDRLIQKLMRR